MNGMVSDHAVFLFLSNSTRTIVSLLKRWLAYVLLFLVFAYGILFSVENTQSSSLDLLVVPALEGPLALWVILAFAIGGVVGILVSAAAILRLKSQSAIMQRKLNRQSEELDKLRTSELRKPLPKS